MRVVKNMYNFMKSSNRIRAIERTPLTTVDDQNLEIEEQRYHIIVQIDIMIYFLVKENDHLHNINFK